MSPHDPEQIPFPDDSDPDFQLYLKLCELIQAEQRRRELAIYDGDLTDDERAVLNDLKRAGEICISYYYRGPEEFAGQFLREFLADFSGDLSSAFPLLRQQELVLLSLCDKGLAQYKVNVSKNLLAITLSELGKKLAAIFLED